MTGSAPTVALIGLGAIGRQLCGLLGDGPMRPTAALLRPDKVAGDGSGKVGHGAGPQRLGSLAALLEQQPDIVVECAGHSAVAEYGPDILAAGKRLVIASVGALADPGVLNRLQTAARSAAGQMIIPAGALGGIDALSAASRATIASVRYRGSKPASAWRGTAAEDRLNLDRLDTAQCFFTGDAAQAAMAYPKNSNVAATVALAGVGFEQTQVELVADPQSNDNVHELEVEADAVSFRLRLEGRPSPDNPKTSMLTALSIARAVENQGRGLAI